MPDDMRTVADLTSRDARVRNQGPAQYNDPLSPKTPTFASSRSFSQIVADHSAQPLAAINCTLAVFDNALLVAVDPTGQADEDELKLIHASMIGIYPLSSQDSLASAP
jgi:hypothetical protein